MAARYTVYCKRSVAHVTPGELLAGVQDADLHTIAEDAVSEDAILTALQQLRIESVDLTGFRWYRLCYRPAGCRQIDVERWQTRDEVQGVVAEVLEDLDSKRHPNSGQVRDHLREVVDIVDASFGSSEGQEIAPVLASEVARWLAQLGQGIICAPDDSWWRLGQHYEYQPF